MTASIKNQTPQPHMKTKDQKSKANPRTTKKAVAPKNIALPRCKSTSIIRNDFNDGHVVSRKPWHSEICNYNFPAADLLSVIIARYDEFQNSFGDGEMYMDDFYLSYLLWTDLDGEHEYGALFEFLAELGLISFRKCCDTKFQHPSVVRCI